MYKIFVGNLAATTDAETLRQLFDRHAIVEDVALPIDEKTGKPRGFAIVMIKDERQGRNAMLALRGTRLEGKALIINQARKKKKGAKARPGPFRGRAGRGFSASGGYGRRPSGRRPYRPFGGGEGGGEGGAGSGGSGLDRPRGGGGGSGGTDRPRDSRGPSSGRR